MKRKMGSPRVLRRMLAAASVAALAATVPVTGSAAAPSTALAGAERCAPAPATTPGTAAVPGVGSPRTADATDCRGGTSATAAARNGWGAPLPQWSDEFDYGSTQKPAVPKQDRWKLAGGGVDKCWPGHAKNGKRCDKNTRVFGGVLRQTGEENGDSGWLASRYGQRYGRWEARVRSQGIGENNDRQYHPLLILWPDSEEHPEDGEYDFLENGAPGEECAEAFIHYPHDPDVPVQQKFAQKCGVDLSQWHNIAVEWTPDHVRGFVDGVQWYSFSGGANDIRKCIQCAPSMHQTIQLDNFYGSDLQRAVYEVDWARVYPYKTKRGQTVK